MATTTKKTTKPAAPKQPKASQTDAETPKAAETVIPAENTSAAAPEEKHSYRVKRDLDPNMFVVVKNGFNGTLVYKSRKTGERFIWEAFGDEQEMELSELKSARNASKAFFVNNWFLIDDPEVIDWLGMTQYYKHALNSGTFDDIFTKSPEEIAAIVSEMSSGQRKTLAFRAKQMIAEGKVDSIRVITALEDSLSVELIER